MSLTFFARLRAWNRVRRQRRHDERADRDRLERDYSQWIARFDGSSSGLRDGARLRARILHERPLISLLMPVCDPDPRRLARAIASLQAQAYDRWELCIADRSVDPRTRDMLGDHESRDARIRVVWRKHPHGDDAGWNAALEIARGHFVAPFDADDALAEHALLCIAETIVRKPHAAVLYADEDRIDDAGERSAPWCKPDWNRELFRARDGLTRLGLLRTSLVRDVGGFRQGFDGAEAYDLALRCVDAAHPTHIVHVPHILYHRRACEPASSRVHALEAHLARHDIAARVTARDNGTCRIDYALPTPTPTPRVAVIVVDGASLARLQRCVHALRAQADTSGVEVLVASTRTAPLRNAKFTGVRWICASHLVLDACNRAIATTTAEFVALVDSRCTAFDADWMRRLVSHAQGRGVGLVAPAVGGVVLGTPQGFAKRVVDAFAATQQVSAVRHGCIVARRRVLLQESGFDPSYGDLDCATVDLSLRIALRELEHHWLPSVRVRIRRTSPLAFLFAWAGRRRDRQRLIDAWHLDHHQDPHWNPNLSLGATDGALSSPPRVSFARPWCGYDAGVQPPPVAHARVSVAGASA